MDEPEAEPTKRSITSEGLTAGAVRACWAVSAILMVSGITATFIAGTGAAPAAMILFGSLFLVLALMKRVPLSLEVGGAKFDASYETAEAFDAGREVGVRQGVEAALEDVEKAEESGESPHAALERRRDSWQAWDIHPVDVIDIHPVDVGNHPRRPSSGTSDGYSGPVACRAAGITYRQLDYWARTGLVTPSARGPGNTRRYSVDDILMLKAIKRLLDTGVSLQPVRATVNHLRERGPGALDGVTLMSDGHSVYEATSTEEVINLVQSGQGVFGIAIGRVRREVEDALRELPAEPVKPDDGV